MAVAAMAPELLAAVGEAIGRLTSDGGYDRLDVYEAASLVCAKVVILPRKDAVLSRDPSLAERNRHIEHRILNRTLDLGRPESSAIRA
ncbi:MAG: hypothetical protein ACI9MC_003870 [Kiritimatiellia bacterium]